VSLEEAENERLNSSAARPNLVEESLSGPRITREEVQGLMTMRASTTDKRTFSLEERARRELQAAGWKLEVGAGGTIWQCPEDRHWYDELRAISLLKEGSDPGYSA
jgi:hypothetical protein